MTAIIGARGIGKTTLILQHIKLHLPIGETLYVSADDFYFAEHKLLDFAEEFHKLGGKYLFIDEIHKYAGWSKVKQLYDATRGVRGLGKVTKLYLENTNLAYILGKDIPDTGNLKETFFFNQLAVQQEVSASSQSDFQVGGYTFEIGGRNKGNAQIQGLDKAYIVKDDIEYGFGNTIPLWHFGFLY